MSRSKKRKKEEDPFGPRQFPVNNHMVVFAFRYALGRRTGAVKVVVDQLSDLWLKLPHTDRTQIKQEIRRAIDQGEAGSDCDILEWQTVLELDTGKPPWKI